ncbi:MAG TPA: DUF998 domain-containing protein [Solirubrobacteraceae bacterium]|nr:DUF998 domain-containing protein [Solirubrobacteraceae bacterium]
MVIAGIVSLVALAVVVTSLAWLHLQPTGLSPVRSPVSQYGITRYRAGYRVATLAFGLAGLALAIALDRAIRGHGEALVVALLVIFAASRCVISWFPMDAPGAQRTSTGAIHGVLAIAAFGSVAYAALRFGRVLARTTRWHSLGPTSTVLGWAMVACLIAIALARTYRAVAARFGAIERGFYVLAIAWVGVFAVACAANVQ